MKGNSLEVFAKLIEEFHQLKIPRASPRHLGSMRLPEGLRKARVLVGMRRSGKTWALYEEMHKFLDEGLALLHKSS